LSDSRKRKHSFLASKVCISVYGRSLSDLKERIREARLFDPAFIELRLDYLEDLSDVIKISKDLLGNEICTFRSRAEGGVTRISENRRLEILHSIISQVRPPLIDIEISTLDTEPSLRNQVELAGAKLICSSHNFHSIESASKLRRLVQRAHKRNSPYAIKIVRRAGTFDDNRRILSLYKEAEKIVPSKLIAFCAGPMGILSRINCISLGSPFTYVSLPNEKTAPGQLEVSTMQTLLEKW
jgi:3-dehydroquinate dehydratase-1